MKPASHIVISFSISVLLYLIFNSVLLSLASFGAGIFVDIDHLVEYFREVGFKIDINKFFQLCQNYEFKKNVLILHSWELFISFSLVVFFSQPNELIYGTYIGYSFHLVFDQLGNLSKLFSYSFIYRWKNNFLTAKIWRIESRGCR